MEAQIRTIILRIVQILRLKFVSVSQKTRRLREKRRSTARCELYCAALYDVEFLGSAFEDKKHLQWRKNDEKIPGNDARTVHGFRTLRMRLVLCSGSY